MVQIRGGGANPARRWGRRPEILRSVTTLLHADGQPRQTLRSGLQAAGLVLVGSLLLGGLTSFGQSYLPDWFRSLGNSAGGWTAFAFLLVWLSRARYALAAVLGVISFELLNEGYGLVSGLRGYFYAAPFSTIWSLVGLVAGPVLGYAAALARYGTPIGRVLGIAVPAAVWLGEGVWALGAVSDTTSPVYWTIEIVGSVVAMVVALARTRLPVTLALITIAVWLVGAAAFYGLIVTVLNG